MDSPPAGPGVPPCPAGLQGPVLCPTWLSPDEQHLYVASAADNALVIFKRNVRTGVETKMQPNEIPQTYALSQNYPNPFNPQTTIRFALPRGSRTRLVIFDILGRQLRTLIDDDLAAGEHRFQWNGMNQQGLPVASGIYIYRLEAGNFVKSRKMLLLR